MSAALPRYSYGGHMTFPVRYGWLPKGVGQLIETGTFTANTQVADALGLGSKMAESLSFWLRATGLSVEPEDSKSRIPSRLSELVFARDRFCELPGTWWFLHLMLATSGGTVWSWFFNHYAERLFDRNSCSDAYLQHTRARAQRPATPAVAQKDVACLLAAYAARPGVDFVDPDDLGACPFRELGLVWRHEHIHRFERTRAPSGVPAEAFLACVAQLAIESGSNSFSLRELANVPKGPGRVFCAGLDALESMAAAAVAHSARARIETLAGERILIVEPCTPDIWMGDLFDRLGTTT